MHAVALGVADHIEVRQDVPARELAKLYRAASLFVLSSNEEGLGIVLLEAMASGLPVVSTRCGGPETVVTEGQTGFLVPVGDAPALVARIGTLLDSDAMRRAMGAAGRRVVVERFSLDAAASPFLQTYDELLARERGTYVWHRGESSHGCDSCRADECAMGPVPSSLRRLARVLLSLVEPFWTNTKLFYHEGASHVRYSGYSLH